MVNRAARDKAAQLIWQFGEGEITNDEFSDDFPRDGKDQALQEIRWAIWQFYDDQTTHKLEGNHALNPKQVELMERCELFLRTDREFAWPNAVRLWQIPLRIIGFANYFQWKFEESGHIEVWPFLRADEYASARKTHLSMAK